MSDFLTFREFETRREADELAAKLKQYSITAVVEQTRNLLDQNFIGKQYNNYVLLKIKGEDFERAQKILIDTTEVDLAQVEKGYMLLSLSNDELTDILAKPDEWGEYNYNLALALLKERGVTIDAQKTETLKQQHITESAKQRSLSAFWIIFGYSVSLISIAACITNNKVVLMLLYDFDLLPGVLGIILGLVVYLTRRTLPNGTQIYSYDNKARKQGLYILLVGILSFALIVVKFVLYVTGRQHLL
ncbi:MAG: hypothetical protein JWQ38_2320 [Flavipsychrobacter sp.]|nr:hypothetical protein [Flavipsychrobacter sp.]